MIRRAVRGRVGMLAGAAILAVVVWRLGTGAFLDGLRGIDVPTLLAALGIGLLTTVFSAWRWCLVARGLSIRLPLGRAVSDYYRALFLNAALPGGVLGDVHRAVRHGQSAGDVGRGVRAVVLERVAGQAVLIAVGVTLLFAHPAPALAEARGLLRRLVPGPGTATVLAVSALLVVVGASAITAAVRPRTGAGTGSGTTTGAARLRRALGTVRAEARLGLFARASWPGVALSSVVVLAGHLGMFLLAARAAGSTAPASDLLPLMVLALLAMALPLNIGGWGPREGVTAWAFGAAGLGAAQGLSVAVVYGVLALAAALPGAGVLVAPWFARLRRPQVEFEEGVLAEDDAARRRPEGVAHPLGSGEAQPGDAVPEQDRRHGHVQPVQCPLVQEAGHGHAAALDQHPAETAPRQLAHQPAGGERGPVRQSQHLDTAAAVPQRPRLALVGGTGTVSGTGTLGAHHPQRRR